MEAECDEEGGNWLRRVLQQSYCQHDLKTGRPGRETWVLTGETFFLVPSTACHDDIMIVSGLSLQTSFNYLSIRKLRIIHFTRK